MGRTRATENEQIGPFRGLIEAYGFVPNLFGLQKKLPRVIEAEQRLIDAIVVRESGLSRGLKDCLLRIVASAQGSDYCRALHAQTDSSDREEDAAGDVTRSGLLDAPVNRLTGDDASDATQLQNSHTDRRDRHRGSHDQEHMRLFE